MLVVLSSSGVGEWLINYTIQRFQNYPFRGIMAHHFVWLQDKFFFNVVFADDFCLVCFLRRCCHLLSALVMVGTATVPQNTQTTHKMTLWEKHCWIFFLSVSDSVDASIRVTDDSAPVMKGVVSGDIFKTTSWRDRVPEVVTRNRIFPSREKKKRESMVTTSEAR